MEDRNRAGNFRGYVSYIGDCMVLRIGMVGFYKAGIHVPTQIRKSAMSRDGRKHQSYWELKRELKKKLLADIDHLFGGAEWPKLDDCIEWEK